ncbi:unnamed protein product [Caenorhabditis bovis]|uniref:GPS domain-containing protein n=1 Tax=Caenorhabditis bovis TaxID=2654633 RepID=A0A8S1FED3_9PELO|nr:unnamed protein product [Caenorhabditis bovis]
MRHLLPICASLLLADLAHSLTYSFSFEDDDQSNFLSTYSLTAQIIIYFHNDGSARFTTTVANPYPLHFSLYANGRNCGIVIDQCSFLIGIGENMKIEIKKANMVSDVVNFVNYGSESNLQLALVGCSQYPTITCISGEQYSTDSRGKVFKDTLCFCSKQISSCTKSTPTDDWFNDHNDACKDDITSGNNNIYEHELNKVPDRFTTQLTTSTTTKKPPTTGTPSTSTKAASTSSTSVQTSTTTSELPATVDPNSIPTLKNLSDSGVGINNVSTVLNDTLWYSQQGADLDSTQVGEIAIILNNCANLRGLSAENSIGILKNLDNVLLVDDETMRMSGSSSDMMLGMLPTMVDNTKDEQINYLDGQNLGFTAKKIDCSKRVQDEGLLDVGNVFEIINSTDKTSKNSIMIPLSDLCSTETVSHVYFTIYRKSTLFVGPQIYRPYKPKSKTIAESDQIRSFLSVIRRDEVGTTTPNPNDLIPPSPCNRQVALPEAPVMTATLLNNGRRVSRATTADAPMAILRFNISDIIKPLHGNFKVTWWDIGRQKWATERNCEIISENDGILEAKCLHLTDFAIIVDALLNDPNVCNTALIVLGYAVNCFSIVSLVFLTGLSITSLNKALSKTSFYNNYIRASTYSRRDYITLAFRLDLLLFYILFTIFANQSVSGDMCTMMASIMYMMLLCSLFLTMFQGIRNALTFGNQSRNSYYNMITSLPVVLFLSVVVPFTLSTTLLVFTTFFDRQDCFCWVRPDYIVVGIIVPVSLLILNSIGCTSYIVYKVFFGMRRRLSTSGNHHHDPHIISKVVSILIMQVSLGLPWILQFLTLYSPYTTLWHYLFTIVMGSQGTMLLLIFAYKTYQSRQCCAIRDATPPPNFQNGNRLSDTSTDSDLRSY